jgi:hypothetical protein
MLLFGALVLIPNWVYFLALSYLLFIAVPNIFIGARGMHDISFTAMLPIRKRDVVKARVLAIVILEVLQIAAGAVCSAINRQLYPQGNMLIDANLAYLGCTFVMYAIFNVIFFPMFYKKAAGAGKPTVIALIPSMLFGFAIEALVVTSPQAAYILDGISSDALIRQIPVLIAGIVIFALITFLSYLKSAKNFEKIDL